jgi:hypothetical protein
LCVYSLQTKALGIWENVFSQVKWGFDIEVTKGDSQALEISVLSNDFTPYTPYSGDLRVIANLSLDARPKTWTSIPRRGKGDHLVIVVKPLADGQNFEIKINRNDPLPLIFDIMIWLMIIAVICSVYIFTCTLGFLIVLLFTFFKKFKKPELVIKPIYNPND